MRICQPVAGVQPQIGTTQLVPDGRICLPRVNVQLQVGDGGQVILYGAAGAISYGGVIIRY